MPKLYVDVSGNFRSPKNRLLLPEAVPNASTLAEIAPSDAYLMYAQDGVASESDESRVATAAADFGLGESDDDEDSETGEMIKPFWRDSDSNAVLNIVVKPLPDPTSSSDKSCNRGN